MSVLQVKGVTIHTNHEYPPIPIRSMDWSAITDDYDGAEDSHCPVGTGATEQEAIDDLIEQLQDSEYLALQAEREQLSGETE